MKFNTPRHCSFCGKSENDVAHLIENDAGNALICNECISDCNALFSEHSHGNQPAGGETSPSDLGELPTPAELVAQLNEHVIGQDLAKKALAVAVYNHYKRLNTPAEDGKVELSKSNILLIAFNGFR